jgi:hypothetical protein
MPRPELPHFGDGNHLPICAEWRGPCEPAAPTLHQIGMNPLLLYCPVKKSYGALKLVHAVPACRRFCKGDPGGCPGGKSPAPTTGGNE